MLVLLVSLVAGKISVQLPNDQLTPMYSHLPHFVSVNLHFLKCHLFPEPGLFKFTLKNAQLVILNFLNEKQRTVEPN